MSRKLRQSTIVSDRCVERKLKGSRVKAAVSSVMRPEPFNSKPEFGISDYVMRQNDEKIKRKRNRRGKNTRRASCRVMDFSQYPVLGNELSFGVSKMLRDREFHAECSRNKVENFNVTLLVKTDKPTRIVKRVRPDGKSVWHERTDEELRAAFREWEDQILAVSARLDKPVDLVKNQPQGRVLGTMVNPLGNPANGKMLKAEFNKIEPTVVASLEGHANTIHSPMFKRAGSWKREIPLRLALWMICEQEGKDAKALYGISDKEAQELLKKFHETAY